MPELEGYHDRRKREASGMPVEGLPLRPKEKFDEAMAKVRAKRDATRIDDPEKARRMAEASDRFRTSNPDLSSQGADGNYEENNAGIRYDQHKEITGATDEELDKMIKMGKTLRRDEGFLAQVKSEQEARRISKEIKNKIS